MPTSVIAGNWKMNGSAGQARELALGLRERLHSQVTGVQVVLCPPFPYLALVKECLQGSTLLLGAQNMHHESAGAFTGEVSPTMLAELCQFVILGHSERRQHFRETDLQVNRKVKAALAAGLRPIVCIGETLKQREAGEAEAVVARQLQRALAGVPDPGGLVVAYEPIWAIGTGVAATPETADKMTASAILPALAALLGEHEALDVPLLYGGSVTAANIEGFVSLPFVHGALVGGASLKADEFAEIVRIIARVKGAL